MISDASSTSWSKHRVEALTDGIFAVAMTLLVIELKVPDRHTMHSQDELVRALLELAPKAASWVLSFLVLATFWISHHRLFHHVRSVDAGLLWRNLLQLGFVSLMPFSAALIGEFGGTVVAQNLYHANMVMLALLGLWKVRYVHAHPELASHAVETGTYHAMRLRLGGLVVAAMIAIFIAYAGRAVFAPFAYLLMIPIGRYARHVERRVAAHPAPGPSTRLPETRPKSP